MVTMAVSAEKAPKATPRGRRLAAWSGIGGALLLGVAAYLIPGPVPQWGRP
jgi:hypothetical protein